MKAPWAETPRGSVHASAARAHSTGTAFHLKTNLSATRIALPFRLWHSFGYLTVGDELLYGRILLLGF